MLYVQKTKAGTAAGGENYKLQPEAVHLQAAKKDVFFPLLFSTIHSDTPE